MAREQEPQGTYSKGPGGIRIYHPSRGEILGAQIGGLAERLRNISAPSPLEIAGSATGFLIFAQPVLTTSHDENKNTSLVSPTPTPETQTLLSKTDTGTEKNVKKETKMSDASIALSHIAGGEFMGETDKAAVEGKIFSMPNGTVVYLDNETLGAVNTELDIGKGIKNPSADQRMELSMAKWEILGHLDESTDFAVLTEKGIFAFHGSNESVDVINNDGLYTIRPQAPDLWYRPALLWDERFGLVSTDEYRATHRHDQEKREWVAFPENVPYGTSKQRLQKYLQDSLDREWIGANNVVTKNIFGIDPKDFADYKTGKTEGFRTFEIMKDAQGNDAFVVIKGGPDGSPYGLRPDLGDIERTKQAVQRLNEVDPSLIKVWSEQGYVMVVTTDLAPGGFMLLYSGYGGAYRPDIMITVFNEVDGKGHENSTDTIVTLIMEGRATFTERYPQEPRLDKNPGVDKGLYTADWSEKKKGRLTSDEYDYLRNYGSFVADWYRKNT